MKIGVIANSEWCIPLLHHLKLNNVETVFYLGSYHAENTNISSLISFCNSNDIPVEVEKDAQQLFSWLNHHQPDYSFVAGYKKLIDVGKLGEFRQRIFNIHPGRLPQYRGAGPIFWQLKNGEEMLGLTIHLLTERYDAGEIIWSRELNNEPHFTYGLVEFIFSNLLVEGVQHVLNSNIDHLVKKAVLQNESPAVTYKKPTLTDVLINWQTMPAVAVSNLIKACNPWNKGALALYNNMEIRIIDAEVAEGETIIEPGTIVEMSDGIKVACDRKSILEINHLNINGIFVPARFGDKFGFTTGQRFILPE